MLKQDPVRHDQLCFSILIISATLASCNRATERAHNDPLPAQPPAQVSSPAPLPVRGTAEPAEIATLPVEADAPRANTPQLTTAYVRSGSEPVSSAEETALVPASAAVARPVNVQGPVIPAGTPLRVRLEQTIDTKVNRPGDRFVASLADPVYRNGNVLIPRGTRFQGHLTEAKRSGRLKGRAVLGMELDSMTFNGATYDVSTGADTRVSGRHRKRNLIAIGGGSGLGALVGGLAAGPVGLLAGAGAGAGAGTAGAFLTGKKDVRLPVETPLTFRLRRSIALR